MVLIMSSKVSNPGEHFLCLKMSMKNCRVQVMKIRAFFSNEFILREITRSLAFGM